MLGRWSARVRSLSMPSACGPSARKPRAGWDLMKRFVPVLIERMQAARLQMLDVYGSKS